MERGCRIHRVKASQIVMTADVGTARAVLIVDDDEDIRTAIHAILEDEGYGVLEAPDGLAALEMLRRAQHPMVVLTNHNMPRLDGPGLISFVLDDPILRGRHAYIYMTAASRVISPAFARQLDTLHVPVLRKPFDLDRLVALIGETAARLADR
jgi:CheY-like chemotaxis protein